MSIKQHKKTMILAAMAISIAYLLPGCEPAQQPTTQPASQPQDAYKREIDAYDEMTKTLQALHNFEADYTSTHGSCSSTEEIHQYLDAVCDHLQAGSVPEVKSWVQEDEQLDVTMQSGHVLIYEPFHSQYHTN